MNIDLNSYLNKHQRAASRFIHSRLKENGFESYLVGGCVRDLLIGLPALDLDMTTDATPEQTMAIFPNAIPVGIDFGTIIVRSHRLSIELTTYRTETTYTDGRRPDKVHFGKSLEEDIYRRDFTMNGLAVDPVNGKIFDYVNGQKDIERKILRTIGSARERFAEDGLRAIRGCRFAAKFELEIEQSTFNAMKEMRSVTANVSVERFTDEWKKTIQFPRRNQFWQLLNETTLLSLFLKPKKLLNNEEMNRLLSFKKCMSIGVYAALLFEVLGYHYDDCKQTLKGLKFSKKDTQVCFELMRFRSLVQKDLQGLRHQLSQVSVGYRKHLRRFMYIHPALKSYFNTALVQFRNRDMPLSISQLKINGSQLANLGFKGKSIGETLSFLQGAVFENKVENNTEALTEYLQKYAML